jgi:hypothetical protein
LFNAYHHALTVDVADFELAEFRAPYGGGIQSHDQGAVKEVTGGVNQATYFLGAEYGRESFAELGERNIFGVEVPVESLEEKETQRGRMLPDGVGRQLLLKQMKLILPDVFRPERIR